MRKVDRHAAIRARCAAAIAALYHNATPDYPDLNDPRQIAEFDSWFENARTFEIEYLQDGGAYPGDYRKTLEAPCNAGRYHSIRARTYYVNWKLRMMREERERCNHLDSRVSPVNVLWERIGEYGDLYQWGRGGRTLAPTHLIRQHGGSSFSTNDDCGADLPIRQCVELTRIVESFNRQVADWCKSIPEQWAEYWAETQADIQWTEDNAAATQD
jgi:hypothetical protein